jgi:hypothetical protein
MIVCDGRDVRGQFRPRPKRAAANATYALAQPGVLLTGFPARFAIDIPLLDVTH